MSEEIRGTNGESHSIAETQIGGACNETIRKIASQVIIESTMTAAT